MFAIYVESNEGQMFWFDAVISKNESYSSKLTHFAIEDGSKITDHKINENLKLSFNTVLTDYDFLTNRPVLPTGYDSKSPMNGNNKDGKVVEIASTKPNALFQLSEVSKLFETNVIPAVKLQNVNNRDSRSIKNLLIKIYNDGVDFTVLGFTNGILTDTFKNCVLTDLAFPEDANTGDAIDCNLTIEQVRRAYLTRKSVQIKIDNKKVTPKKVKKGVKNAASPKEKATNSNGGTQCPTTVQTPLTKTEFTTSPTSAINSFVRNLAGTP